MEAAGTYIARLCAGGVLTGLAVALSGGKEQIRWICGLLLVFLAVAPLGKLDLDAVWDLTEEIELDASAITSRAREDSIQKIREGIIRRTQAYILDEAESLGADIQVIALSLEEDGFLPVRVELRGTVDPNQRARLSRVLEDDLGIGKEGQIWKE